jgi:2-dehydropantoate 2-reductase
MKVAVMGAGGVGGYFGGMLSRGGNRVTLVARGPHLRAISAHGLTVITNQERLTIACDATDDPRQVGTADLVLLAVKTYHNEQAIAAMLPMVGPDTVVLCLQNGIDSYQAAVAGVGPEKVLPGAAYIEARIQEPGVVKQTGKVVRIVFGELDGSESERGKRILQALEGAGIPTQFDLDIHKTLWTKFLFIATVAGVTSLSRETMAELASRPEWRPVILGCMAEIEAVARASGIGLDSGVVERTMDYIEANLVQMHASMHADIMAGRHLEIEAINGAAVRAGRAAGVPTPINDVIYAMLKPYEKGKS